MLVRKSALCFRSKYLFYGLALLLSVLAAASAGGGFDRGKMGETLAGLGNRVFLMNNVNEDHPVVFQSRWAMSYLRGPLTRGQIKTLMDGKRPAPAAPAARSDRVRFPSGAGCSADSSARIESR
jgi:hypothetical protein